MYNKLKQAIYAAASLTLALPVAALAGSPPSTGAWTNTGRPNAQGTGLPSGSIYNIISTTLAWLLGILGFIAIIGFVISGILYLTAAGDESQIEKAKSAMMYSIIGVIVALVGWVIVQAVGKWLQTGDNTF